MKFICLPGYLQSGKIFAEKTSGIRKALSKHYTLDYVDPPMVINSKEELVFNLGGTEEEQNAKWAEIVAKNCNRCWFRYESAGEGRPKPIYHGFDDSMQWLAKYIDENGPYDGIIGFSQGAAVATITANTITKLVPKNPFFKVAVIVSGFAFMVKDEHGEIKGINPDYQDWFKVPEEFPTKMYFIYGSEDQVVAPERSKELAEAYTDYESVVHDGGHYVPNKKPIVRRVVESIGEVGRGYNL